MNSRLLALVGVAVCAVALPLAVASAGQVGDEGAGPLAVQYVLPCPPMRAAPYTLPHPLMRAMP